MSIRNRWNRRILYIPAVLLLTLSMSFVAWAGQTEHIKIVLNSQNGTGGTAEIHVVPGSELPDINPPTRWGYSFEGYYSAASGLGKQYYNASGTALGICEFQDSAALYAFWKVSTYTITYENMEQAQAGTDAPVSHTYGKNTIVSDPTRVGYTFFGWQINKSLVAAHSLTLGANTYADDIFLTAVWNKATLVTEQNNSTDTVAIGTADLMQVFQRQVNDPLTGVTAEDLNSEEVCLTMTASDADGKAEGAEDIIELSQGEVLKFYDFSVSKKVTKLLGEPVQTDLHQLPNTVLVEITLSESLQKRSSYRVYRYHNGQAEAIPMGPVEDSNQQKESFELSADGTKLMLYTRRLSTYAVVCGEKALGGAGTVENGTVGLDVQAQVKEGGDGPVYKIDLVWGPMRFTYSTGREWDPNEHRYTNVRIYDWIPAECYTGGNNRITVYNHSNADVMVGFEAFPLMKAGADSSLMDGVDMVVSSENRANGLPATEVLLQKVPAENAPAPAIYSYLRLNGSPTDPEFYEGLDTDGDGYVQVADIAVTITHLDGPRTPKKK